MPDDPLATKGMLELDIALARCAQAAVAWSNPARRSEALPLLMAAMSTVARANHARPPAMRPHEFWRLLSTPASSWLPGAPAESLLENGRPSTYALDLICESGDDP